MNHKYALRLALVGLCALLTLACGLGDLFGPDDRAACLDRSDPAAPGLAAPDASALSGAVAFLSARDDPNGEIYLSRLPSGTLTRLTFNQLAESDLTAAPDGSALAFGADGSVYVFDLACAKTAAGCAQQPPRLLAKGVSQPDWTRRGIAVTLAFEGYSFSSGLSDAALVNPSSGELKAFGLGDDGPTCGDCGIRVAARPRLNPISTCMLYQQRTLPGQSGLSLSLQEFSFLADVPRVGECPALLLDGAAQDAVWLPDGQRAAWGGEGICAAAPEQPTALWTPGQKARRPAFSSDGRWLAFDSDLEGQDEVYVMSVPAGGEVNRGGQGQLNLSRSPAKDWGAVWVP